MRKSSYTCACCGRTLPYDKRVVFNLATGREREETFGRWVMSSFTRNRYCWPGECRGERRRGRKVVTA